MILTDDSPKCFNRNVLITGVCEPFSQPSEHTHKQTHRQHMEETGSLSPTCMCYTSCRLYSVAHNDVIERALCVCEQGDRVTLAVRQTILQPDSQRFNGPTCFFSRCPCAKR